jgi:ribosomal protein L40E
MEHLTALLSTLRRRGGSVWYCGRCGAENGGPGGRCRSCGAS